MAGTGIEREPCPYRIIDDAGGAFAFGLVGGGIWHSVGGFRNAPKGKGFSQAFSRVKARAPILGGSFAIWGTFFSIFDCSIASIRQKEDPWNAIISGAATGGLLALRGGLKAAGTNAVAGGVILAAIEGLNIAVQRIIMPMFEKQQQEQAMLEGGGQVNVDLLEPPVDPLHRRHKISGTNSILDGLKATPIANSAASSAPIDYEDTFAETNTLAETHIDTGVSAGFDMSTIDTFDTHSSNELSRVQETKSSSWW